MSDVWGLENDDSGGVYLVKNPEFGTRFGDPIDALKYGLRHLYRRREQLNEGIREARAEIKQREKTRKVVRP